MLQHLHDPDNDECLLVSGIQKFSSRFRKAFDGRNIIESEIINQTEEIGSDNSGPMNSENSIRIKGGKRISQNLQLDPNTDSIRNEEGKGVVGLGFGHHHLLRRWRRREVPAAVGCSRYRRPPPAGRRVIEFLLRRRRRRPGLLRDAALGCSL